MLGCSKLQLGTEGKRRLSLEGSALNTAVTHNFGYLAFFSNDVAVLVLGVNEDWDLIAYPITFQSDRTPVLGTPVIIYNGAASTRPIESLIKLRRVSDTKILVGFGAGDGLAGGTDGYNVMAITWNGSTIVAGTVYEWLSTRNTGSAFGMEMIGTSHFLMTTRDNITHRVGIGEISGTTISRVGSLTDATPEIPGSAAIVAVQSSTEGVLLTFNGNKILPITFSTVTGVITKGTVSSNSTLTGNDFFKIIYAGEDDYIHIANASDVNFNIGYIQFSSDGSNITTNSSSNNIDSDLQSEIDHSANDQNITTLGIENHFAILTYNNRIAPDADVVINLCKFNSINNEVTFEDQLTLDVGPSGDQMCVAMAPNGRNMLVASRETSGEGNDIFLRSVNIE